MPIITGRTDLISIVMLCCMLRFQRNMHAREQWWHFCSQKSMKNPFPNPKDVQLDSDAWLASLATGETDSAVTSSTAAVLLLQAALAAAAVMALLL
ncbi:hypothetical protein PR202_ga16470 [Eleusine coracana subsp. coracana]|uniref:Uncharacterized protein n=1 Tax=Eleusine coracana subsp. coracana TaxID=191504 RepID=A0AAV5CMX4_ELECO|nr:hypothetical protein PR202_ga16470 [Eleusine coracana subsp. coracana]